MEISFEKPDDTWSRYGLAEFPVLINNRETRYKAIARGNKLVTIVGKGYYLYPNEEALKIADKAAKLVGLQPFQATVAGLKSEGHALYNQGRTQMRALYLTPENHKVDGDKVNVGVNVFNSIDGSTSFGCSLFTFREICSNGVIFGKETVFSVRRIHTVGLEKAIETLKTRILRTMEQASDLLADYKLMAQMKVTEELVERLKKSRLPKRILPDYIQEEEAEIPNLTQWQLYNDITEAIWHNARTGLKSKAFQYKTLHAAMEVH